MTSMLLTCKQVAEKLQLRPHRVYDLVREGRIPHVRIGKQIRFSMDQIDAWLSNGGSPLQAPSSGGKTDAQL